MIATSQDYRRITGDLNSYDGDVVTALGEAQAEFLRQTGRIIELGTYGEMLPVYDDGRVYPSASPITGVLDPPNAVFDEISVSVPAAASSTLDMSAWPGYYPAYSGYAYGGYVGGYQPLPSDLLIGTDRRPPPLQRTVTYTGGYAKPPADVVRCICEMVAISLHPDLQLQTPGGTESVTLGDQSITGSFAATTAWPPSVTRVLSRYTRTDPTGTPVPPNTVIIVAPTPVDLVFPAGNDFSLDLTVTDQGQPVDLTGATVDAWISDDTGTRLADFTVTGIDGNVIHLHLDNQATAGLPPTCQWECQLTRPPDEVTTLAAGTVTVT